MLKNLRSGAVLPRWPSRATALRRGWRILEVIDLAVLARRIRRALIALDLHVVLADPRRSGPHPVAHALGAADQVELVRGGDRTGSRRRSRSRRDSTGTYCFALPSTSKPLKHVDAEAREEALAASGPSTYMSVKCATPLVEQHARFPARRAARRASWCIRSVHTRIGIRAGLRVAQQVDRVSCRPGHVLKALHARLRRLLCCASPRGSSSAPACRTVPG